MNQHRVTVLVEGREIDGWTSYEIQSSLVTPADAFRLSRPFDDDAWQLCSPDAEVSVLIDGVAVITGYIDDSDLDPDSDDMTIAGRDKIGRLVQESAPAFEFASLTSLQLIEQLAAPWFRTVAGSNARNRKVVRGKRGKIAASSPVVLRTKKTTGARVEPGQTRWAAITKILEQTGNLAISSGDGRELVVFSPRDEQQEPQFRFVRAARRRRAEEGNCTMGHRRSVGDLYSRIDVVGSGVGDANRYGVSVSARSGSALDSASAEDGTGDRFRRPKRMLLVEAVRSLQDAEYLARREMARRQMGALVVPVVAPLHGQRIAGGRDVTLFACDTIASVENRLTGLQRNMRVVSCEYTSARSSGESTRMELLPAEQEIFI